MKKTRKILSIVLAVVFAFSSMPVVYTGTAAADAVPFAAGGEGTLDNPTRPVASSGMIEREDLYKMNINSQSTSYTFYQTIDNEYFTFGQTQGLQHYYDGTDTGSRTLTFESIAFYEGESGVSGNTEPVEISAGFGMWESPVITSNPTSEYLSKYHVSSTWSATNSNAQALTSIPFVLDGGLLDFGGCKVYTWQNDIVFKGNGADVTGEINTGYYEQLFWNWVRDTESARFDLRIGTTIRVIDARELVKEMAEAEYIIDNPDDYTQAYVSSVEATLNTLPDDLRDLSTVYDQSVIDSYTQMLKDVSLNSADYTEFNELYKSLKSITNAKGAYTEESFSAFETEIAEINANLPKNLDKTQQATVDAATQALRDAFDKLVATDVSETLTPSTHAATGASADARTSFSVDNSAFHLMQTKDDQVFQIKQQWTIKRNDDTELGEQEPDFIGMTLDTTNPLTSHSDCLSGGTATLAPNNTSTFITRCVSCVESSQFTCWNQVSDSKGTNWISNGKFNSGIGIVKNSTTVLEVSPTFKGLANGETAEGGLSLNFLQKFEYTYDIGYWPSKTTYTKHFHVNSTVEITDVRQLISAVEGAKQTIANPGTHSENYITALQAAVDSVPVEMLRGVEYYTQAEVDNLYNDITTIPEDVADYSEFVEVFESMLAENKDKFTEESYNAFIDEIYAINQGLDKNLTVDQQATVDAAVDALYAAHDKLVSSHLNDNNVFTQDDISDTGNNPLAFSVSSTEYNFMQIADAQKFAIRTYLSVENTKPRYTCNLLSLRFSTVTADTLASICEARTTPDKGCHNGENVTTNQSELVLQNVTGVNTYAVNEAGDIGEYNTWVNESGVALSTNGVLNDPTEVADYESTAYAEMYYVGASGNQETPATVNVTYAYRLGWSYHETVLGVEGDIIRRHAHIPVTVNITDARALNTLYEEVSDILEGKTETNYTFNSLVNLYNAHKAVDEDMAYGNTYYTQEEVNAEYAALKAAYEALEEGADYSEYFKAYVKAEEIINTNNTDSRGNALYDEEAYKNFVETVNNIDNALNKDLSDSEENQKKIDDATAGINTALETLENSKFADYSRLNDAMTEAEKILAEEEANPGTYTQETIDAIQEAYDNALENAFNNDSDATHNELPASEQATVDAAASALEAVIADKEYKADYSEFDEAYNKVQDILNNSDKYTDETVKAAENAMNTAGAISKDLADTAENRQTIKEAADALNNVADNAGEKANYTDYNNAKAEADAIINAGNVDANGNAIYNESAFNAYQQAVNNTDTTLNKDLSTEYQTTVDEATADLEEAKATLENNKNADYTRFNELKAALEDIVNNPDEYTSDSVNAAQSALDNANKIPDGLPVGENNMYQNMIDSASNTMEQVLQTVEKKADYTDFDKVVSELENIVNNPDEYTSDSVKAAEEALKQAEQVSKDIPESKQPELNEITNSLQEVVNSAENKADYTEYDKVVEELKNIVNNPDDYTSDSVKAAEEALKQVENVSKDLPESAQPDLDSVTESLKQVVDATQKKANYTDYNTAKDYADSLVNDDGNGNPIYDEEAFQQYKDAVEKIDSALIKDLPESEQATVDEATQALKDLRTELEASKGSEQEIIDPETTVDKIVNDIINDITQNQGYTEDEIVVEFKNYLGEELAGEEFVGTGSTMRVILKSTGEILEHKMFIVMGDVTGDGQINADDYAQSKAVAFAGEIYAEENYYFFTANDMDADGYIDVIDTALIRRMYR